MRTDVRIVELELSWAREGSHGDCREVERVFEVAHDKASLVRTKKGAEFCVSCSETAKFFKKD